MINYLHLSLDCFINYSIESLMINYRRLAEESLSDSQFILSQSWPAPLRIIREFLSRALGGGHDALRRSRGGGLGSLGWHWLG